MYRPIALAAALFLAPVAQAHPHVFVSVEVTVIYEGDSPAGVKLDWTYDEYFSLLITSDLGVDLDGDLVLTADELTTLNESITVWPDGFTGDLEVSQNDAVLALADRQSHAVTFEDGFVRETHIRPVIGASDAPLTVRAYDPFYYVEYTLVGEVKVLGNDACTVAVTPPDLNAAYSLIDELLYGRPASDVGEEEAFPEVGREFSERIDITCAA